MAVVKGGEKARAAIERLAARLNKPATLRVGFLAGATYPNGTSVAMVAAIQNYGAPKVGIPPRPFFSNMVHDKSPGWPKQMAGVLKAADFDAALALQRMGAGIKGQLQDAIIETDSPALSPVTVMLRGMRSQNPNLVVNRSVVAQARARVAAGLTNYGASTKALVDSADMLNAADYEVKS